MKFKYILYGVVLLGIGIAIGFVFHEKEIKAQIMADISPTVAVGSTPRGSGASLSSGSTNVNLPSQASSSFSLPSQSQSTGNESNSMPNAPGIDPSIENHTNPNGGRTDLVQVGQIIVSQPQVYTGDDINFTVTLENVAPYKKFVRQVCFNSNDGNFGCTPGFNLNPGQVFQLSNSGRFTSSGVKSIGVTWTQDGTNFYSPVNASSAIITVL